MAKSKTKAPKMDGLTETKTSVKKTSTKKPVAKKEVVKEAVKTDSSDIIVGTSEEVEALTKAKAMKLAPELVTSGAINDFKLGGVLTRIQEESWWDNGEYESFKKYVGEVLGLEYRKAMYLANIYDKLTEAEVKWEDVCDIGWSKLRFIVNHITAKNAKQWAKRCLKMNALEIQDYVKQLEAKKKGKNTDDSEPTPNSISTMSFKLHEDQKEMVREALDKKKEEVDTEVDAVALENIALDYINGSTGKSKGVTKAAVKKYLKELGEEKTVELLLSIYPNLGEEDEEDTKK